MVRKSILEGECWSPSKHLPPPCRHLQLQPFPLWICDVLTSSLRDLRLCLPFVYLCSQTARYIIPWFPQVASWEKVDCINKGVCGDSSSPGARQSSRMCWKTKAWSSFSPAPLLNWQSPFHNKCPLLSSPQITWTTIPPSSQTECLSGPAHTLAQLLRAARMVFSGSNFFLFSGLSLLLKCSHLCIILPAHFKVLKGRPCAFLTKLSPTVFTLKRDSVCVCFCVYSTLGTFEDKLLFTENGEI